MNATERFTQIIASDDPAPELTTTTLRLPVRVAGQIALFLAGQDPRCGSAYHNDITRGHRCPACHLMLSDYAGMLRTEWPS